MNKISELNSGLGYYSLNAINNDILKYIKNSIKNSLFDLLSKNNLIPNDSQESILDSYKNISNDDWISLFNKENRTLKKKYAEPINAYFNKYLTDLLNCKVQIRDILKKGYPSFSFRIVRPLVASDIGPLHADQWFIDIGATKGEKSNNKKQIIKFWVPINVDSESSNLIIIPNSHKNKEQYKYDIVKTKNGIKPLIRDEFDKKEIYMIKNKNGFPIIFHMNLIHGGAINKDKDCRLSLEFEFSI